jgi:pre-rRNA-processing protein TSR1
MYLEHHFPGDVKLFSMSIGSECQKAIRLITGCHPKPILWRDRHSYMIPDRVEFIDSGLLKLTGFIRGAPLSANRLIHLPNLGDFAISKITSCPLRSKDQMMVDTQEHILDTPEDGLRESLVSMNEPDPMDGEQTWPTDEEILEAEMSTLLLDHLTCLDLTRTDKKKRRVPKGTSSYQAAWIMDPDEEDPEEEEQSFINDDDLEMHAEDPAWAEEEDLEPSLELLQESDEEEYEEVDLEDKKDSFDNALDKEEEEKQ